MNILIENAESQEYLANDGKWTKNAGEGRDFGATQAAFEAASREPIGKFNIVCYILQKQEFIIITLDQGTGKGTSTCPDQESLLPSAAPGATEVHRGEAFLGVHALMPL
jgi:hypothetical protein